MVNIPEKITDEYDRINPYYVVENKWLIKIIKHLILLMRNCVLLVIMFKIQLVINL